MCVVCPDVRCHAIGEVEGLEGLPTDWLSCCLPVLTAGGLVPPLFLHLPQAGAAADRRLTEGTFEREWEQRVAAIFRSQVGGWWVWCCM